MAATKQDITYRLKLELIAEGADGARAVLGDSGIVGTVHIPASATGAWLESIDPRDLFALLLAHLKTGVHEEASTYPILRKFAEEAYTLRRSGKPVGVDLSKENG